MSELKRPETLATAVMKFIGDAVIRGEFGPGEPLPEVPLAKRLETSRGTVREALRALQDLGLVEIRAHRGAFVSELSLEHAEQIISLRALLESWAARLAVERGFVTPEVIADIEGTLARLRQVASSGDAVAAMEADMDFHRQIAEACHHGLLLEHLTTLQAQTRRATFYARLYDAVRDVVGDHVLLLDAFRSGDADRAAAAVRDHIESAGKILLERMAAIERERAPEPRSATTF
jgi:DNA-binding GntR family transcriptional regulator